MEPKGNHLILTGEIGYKTLMCNVGAKLGDFYYEVTVLPPNTPAPFVGVQSSVRVGFAVDDQNIEMPVGAQERSYGFNQNGRCITDGAYDQRRTNETFGTGDVIGVYLHLIAEKPAFLRQSNGSKLEVS